MVVKEERKQESTESVRRRRCLGPGQRCCNFSGIQDASIFCLHFGVDFYAIWAPSWDPSCGHVGLLWPTKRTQDPPKKQNKRSWASWRSQDRLFIDFWLIFGWCLIDSQLILGWFSTALSVRLLSRFSSNFCTRILTFLLKGFSFYCYVKSMGIKVHD